eukprot:scpid50576/ scgid9730/ Tyrosine-protein phosphatase Lar; Protein-tyrosine-phosphate phosphohydrolase; dLAR
MQPSWLRALVVTATLLWIILSNGPCLGSTIDCKPCTCNGTVLTSCSGQVVVNLDNKNLTSIQDDAFHGSPFLKTISLYQNKITSLPPGVFSQITNLQTLGVWDVPLSLDSSLCAIKEVQSQLSVLQVKAPVLFYLITNLTVGICNSSCDILPQTRCAPGYKCTGLVRNHPGNFTCIELLKAPSNLKVESTEDETRKLKISWTAVTYTHYHVSNYVIISTIGHSNATYYSTSTMFKVEIPLLGIPSTFKVAAVSSAGTGPYALYVKEEDSIKNKTFQVVKTSSQNMITCTIIPMTGYYTISKYCVHFTRQSVSNVSDVVKNTTTVCKNESTISLQNLEEDSDFKVETFVKTLSGQQSNKSILSIRTKAAAPGAVPRLNVTNVNYTTITLSWRELALKERNGPIFGYIVDIDDRLVVNRLNTTNLTVQLTGLSPNTQYQIGVAARGYQYKLGPMTSTNVTTLDQGSPTLNVTSTTTNITVEIQPSLAKLWKPKQFCITIDAIPVIGHNWTLTFNTRHICGDKDIQTFSDLEEFTTYLVTSWVINTLGVSGANTIMNISTKTSIPSSGPQSMNASSSDSEIVFTWNPPAEIHQNGIITHYKIAVTSRAESDIKEDNVVFGNVTTSKLINLQPHTNYTISVSAATSEGFGPAMSISVATREASPTGGPSIDSIRATGSSSIMITWVSLTQEVLRGVLQGYTLQYIDTTSGLNGTIEVGSKAKSANLTQLQAYTKYNISVRAKTGAGAGPYGKPVTQKTYESVPATGPSIL